MSCCFFINKTQTGLAIATRGKLDPAPRIEERQNSLLLVCIHHIVFEQLLGLEDTKRARHRSLSFWPHSLVWKMECCRLISSWEPSAAVIPLRRPGGFCSWRGQEGSSREGLERRKFYVISSLPGVNSDSGLQISRKGITNYAFTSHSFTTHERPFISFFALCFLKNELPGKLMPA